MDRISAIEKAARETGFLEFGYVQVRNLEFHPEIRAICEQNKCRGYNTCWACPPAVGTLADCRARTARYDKMMVFSCAYPIEDSFDFQGMTEAMHAFKKLTDRFQQKLSPILSDYLLLSNEGCGRCPSCTYPDAPCRFPELLQHSLEGYGFIVHELAQEAGIRYRNGANTVTFFGALLFQDDPENSRTGT